MIAKNTKHYICCMYFSPILLDYWVLKIYTSILEEQYNVELTVSIHNNFKKNLSISSMDEKSAPHHAFIGMCHHYLSKFS